MPDTPDHTSQTLLSFDYGRRRIGIAVGQHVTRSASPLDVAANGADGPDWAHIARCVAEWRPALLLVGMPFHADGSENEMTAEVREFVAELGRFRIPIECVDERHTSQEAAAGLRANRAAGRRGRVRRHHVDAAAAVVIAERWLRGETLPTGAK